MIAVNIKADVKQERKGLVAVYYNTVYKKNLQNVKCNVKQRCIFHLILVGVPSSLILWRRRCGWRVFYLLEKFCVKHISLTKAICWESLHSHTDVKMIGSAVTEKSSFKVWGFFSSKMNWVLTLPLLLKMSVGKLEPWLILKGFSSSEVEIYLYNSKAYTALYEILFSCLGWCPQFLDMLNKLQKQVLLGCWSYIWCISWTLGSTLICSQFTSFR